MLFNSLPFVIFFPVVTALFFLLPHKFRWFLLLAASCFFYMFFKPVYILILAFTIVIDYYAGILLENEPDKTRKKKYLVMSLIANIGILAVFKYYNFLNTNVTGVALLFGYKNPIPFLRIALPIGLSFHTFQAMSYTIEVYRGNQKAERHFGIYALYVMFYPQLVAGPIERPQNVLHQFHEKKYFDYNKAVSGIRQMVWGMFKKAVIADRLATFTDPILNDPHSYPASSILIACVFFAFQIYCDFSGYSDIALGSARVMGFDLMVNFDHPFSSRSITEFWRRWHISLSTWFYDYLFNPIVLALRNWGKSAVIIGLLVTFGLSGLWHGAGWKYIIYGLLNGVALIYEYFTKKQRKKIFNKLPQAINTGISRVLTFSFMCFCWIFFRANTLSDAFYMIRKLPHAFGEFVGVAKHTFTLVMPIADARVVMCVVVLLVMELVHAIQKKTSLTSLLQKQPRYIRWSIYYVFVFAIIYLGIFHNRQFIYFQF